MPFKLSNLNSNLALTLGYLKPTLNNSAQGITVVPREIQDKGYAKFWGVNKVHYGLCENGTLRKMIFQSVTRAPRKKKSKYCQ